MLDGGSQPDAGPPADDGGVLQAATLKWANGGCYSSWCETGWYSSPAVANLDDAGAVEVIGALYSVFTVNGETGADGWRVALPGRAWPGVIVGDLDDNGDLEIAVGSSDASVTLVDHTGTLVGTHQPFGDISNEVRGLAAADLEGDGPFELIVTKTGNEENIAVISAAGVVRGGWPQVTTSAGSAWGVYNANVAVGDIDGDDFAEIVLPSDVHYIAAYERDGSDIAADAVFGVDKVWGDVGVWKDAALDERGWGSCTLGSPERFRPNFANSPATLADVDGDGSVEIIATGNMYDCAEQPYLSLYTGVFLFHADRTRFSNASYDWYVTPQNTGAPISEDYNVIESATPNPVVVDLDGDGEKEILYSSYDGRVHAFWLDKTEHGSWPYSVYDVDEGFLRFASEPVVADLNYDGRAEVLFVTWTEKGSGANGHLIALDSLGEELWKVELPDALSGSIDQNGALAAPTLANIDTDADLEIVITTIAAGLVAFDLPGTENAQVLWGTGRGSYLRGGL